MCGFVGFLLPTGMQRPDLDMWSEVIRHRGPDQAGRGGDRSFGIGTRRLSIQDLSPSGDQPMQSERYIIGFNGEIYNHLELRAEMPASDGAEFRSHSDTETILRAIEYWGIPATLNRLNGMFALAIWDKVEEELTLVRDSLGVKPLYYLTVAEGIYFGSEVKALRPFSTGKLSQEGLALYLHFGFVPAPYSLLANVHKLHPGEALAFKNGETHRFRIVPQAWSQPAQLAPTRGERVHQVRSAVEAAVRRQLLSDVPVGLFLSGGVDSSVIAAVASTYQQGLMSFSLRPGTTHADPGAQRDAEIAARYAHRLGLSHNEVLLHPEDLTQELEAFIELIDEPVCELYSIAEVLLSRAARALGVPVVLTGHGGDEVFLGYPTYAAVFRGDTYNTIPLLGPMFKAAASAPWLSIEGRQNLLGAASVWRKQALDRYAIISAVHFSLEDVAILTGLMPDYVRDLVQHVISTVRESVLLLPRGVGRRTAELFARLDMLLMVPEHYNARLDRATMSASVEARVPLQDLELIGFVSQLSYRDLLRGGLKGLLKQAFSDVLPREVTQRPKQTFQAPMLSWIAGPLAPWVGEQLDGLPLPRHGDLPFAGAPLQSTRQASRAWILALLEGWRKSLALEY